MTGAATIRLTWSAVGLCLNLRLCAHSARRRARPTPSLGRLVHHAEQHQRVPHARASTVFGRHRAARNPKSSSTRSIPSRTTGSSEGPRDGSGGAGHGHLEASNSVGRQPQRRTKYAEDHGMKQHRASGHVSVSGACRSPTLVDKPLCDMLVWSVSTDMAKSAH
jgi:hypothetical protein